MTQQTRYTLVFAALMGVFSYVFVVNAWVVDDAYITFRTVQNFVNGYGLTWNVDERVQVYTHPMWMFLMSLSYLLTSDVFYTSLFLSYALSVGTLLIAAHRLRRDAPWKPLLLVIALLTSKAFLDFTSSGMETPLSYLLAVLFHAKFLLSGKTVRDFTTGDLLYLFLVASLAVFNRQDTVLLYLPALLAVTWAHLPKLRRRFLSIVLIGTLPATSWLAFSLVYYGSPLPNTVYAKVVTTAVPFPVQALRGWHYLTNSLAWDTASHALLVLAIVIAYRRRAHLPLLALGGVLLYIAYTVTTAAAATHMSGRFFAVPFLISSVAFTLLVQRKRTAVLSCAALAIYMLCSPVSSIKMGTRFYKALPSSPSIVDTKWHVYREGAALTSPDRPGPRPDHAWFRAGRKFRTHPARVHVGGAFGGDAIGYFGYAAGPDKHIIDYVALGDPLLARLPTCRTELFVSGHFRRPIPEGYIASIKASDNLIADPSLRAYYDRVRRITRGPILDRRRLTDIFHVNSGHYQHLLDEYVSRTASTLTAPDCIRRISPVIGPVN